MNARELAEELWVVIQPLLPPEPPKPKGGRPRIPDRNVLTGIIFMLLSSCSWANLPAKQLGSGGFIAFSAIFVVFGGFIAARADQPGVGVVLALLIVLPALLIEGPRVLLVLGPVFGVGFAVGIWPDLLTQIGFFTGISLGWLMLLAILNAWLDLRLVPGPSRVETRLEGTAKPFLGRFWTGLLCGVVPTLIIFAESLADYALASVAVCLTVGVAAGLAAASTVWLDVPSDASSMASPSITLRLDRAAAWTSAVVIGFLIVAACWLSGILFLRLTDARHIATDTLVKAGIASAITLGITVLASRSWGGLFLTRVWLALTGRLPWRLMGFLADAHRRGILHQTGAVYQFTHGRLQDRLVANAKHADR